MIYTNCVVLLAVIACASANSCHKDHERYGLCGGSCEPTCRDPYPDKCNAPCRDGCSCDHGYVRDHNHLCVRRSECRHKRRCGPNEKYGKCPRKCLATCDYDKPRHCEHKCRRRGCICKDGFVKDKDGNCIPKALCPRDKVCKKNEKWSDDKCVPPATCQKPRCHHQRLPKYCPLYCTDGGCVCKNGYVRNKRGRCILEKDCDSSETKSSSTDESDDCSDSCRSDSKSDSTTSDSSDESSECKRCRSKSSSSDKSSKSKSKSRG